MVSKGKVIITTKLNVDAFFYPYLPISTFERLTCKRVVILSSFNVKILSC